MVPTRIWTRGGQIESGSDIPLRPRQTLNDTVMIEWTIIASKADFITTDREDIVHVMDGLIV